MTEDKFTLIHNDAIANMVEQGMGKYITKKEALEETRHVFFSSIKTSTGAEVQKYAIQTWVVQ